MPPLDADIHSHSSHANAGACWLHVQLTVRRKSAVPGPFYDLLWVLCQSRDGAWSKRKHTKPCYSARADMDMLHYEIWEYC